MSSRIDLGAYYLVERNNSPYWWVRAFSPLRQPLFRSTGQSDQRLAKKEAKRIFDEWAQEKKLKAGQKILYEDLFREFEAYREPFLSLSTHTRLKGAGKHLLPHFGNSFLEEVQSGWSSFVIKQRKLRPKSNLFNERKYLIASMQYAFEQGYIDKQPRVKGLRVSKNAGKVYSDPEINRILAKCKSPELRLQILMALTMGMRFGEIAYLEVERIDLKKGTVKLGEEDTKTRRARTIAVSKAVLEPLKAQMEAVRKRSPWLFPQKRNSMQPCDLAWWQRLWQDLKTEAKVEGRFHDFRHTCATRIAQSKVSPETACAYLGMSLRVYDATYCHLDDEDTKAASEVVQLPDTAQVCTTTE